ncbi:unnamed protein product [Bemisia tabaci]|uniref:Major facilitator superfamily (MFS) profile domain-containing protein n=1 Tax=Bemisia tabaci TaxID=7038 RepID=A0A9P0EWC8_BEMTA|nr:unnamed protein product [Bemisia tabaci]
MSDSQETISAHDEVPLVPRNTRYGYSSKSTYAQVSAVLIQSWLFIDLGLQMTMPTLVLGALHRNPDAAPLDLDDDQASWFGSIPDLSLPLASLSSGLFQDTFGRKGSMMLVTIPLFSGWLLLYSARSITTLYAVAVIWGLVGGLCEAPLMCYMGEIGEPHLRGTLSSISTLATLTGSFMMYTLGYFFDWRTAALVCSAFPAITFVIVTQMPESPSWLIARNRLDDAKKALCWLRGWVEPHEVEEEFQDIVNYTRISTGVGTILDDSDQSIEGNSLGKKDGYLKTQYKQMTDKKILRPLRLIFALFSICGVASVAGNRPYLIGELTELGVPINPKLVLIGALVCFTLGAMGNVIFLRRFGKRNIALVSHFLGALCIFGIGAYCSYAKVFTPEPQLRWLPVILWFTLQFLAGLSIILLPWQLVSEVFPLTGRGLASGIAGAWAHLSSSILVKSYLYTESLISLSGIMYLYGCGTVVGLIYLYFYLPETEGKSLEQIETYFTDQHDRKEKFSIGRPSSFSHASP